MSIRRFLTSSLIALGALSAVPLTAGPRPAGAADYERYAKAVLEEMGASDASSALFDFESALVEHSLYAQLGLFRLHGPVGDFIDGDDAGENFVVVADQMIALQRHFLGWVEPAVSVPAEVHADFELLTAWVEKWTPKKMESLGKKSAGDLLDLLEASDEVRGASERLAKFMGTGAGLPIGRTSARPEPVVVVNDRARFRNFMAFAGWMRPDLQPTFWQENTQAWASFFLDGTSFYATKYAGGETGTDGIPMTTRGRTALEQQITQLAMNALVDNIYGAKIPEALANGLSINLVVDLFGECNTRVDGDLRERRTEAIEVFIPGAPLDNGSFGKIAADSRWRKKDQGKKRFVPELKKSQKRGGSSARRKSEKNLSFELEDDDSSRETTIRGPFLGPDAAAPNHSQDFEGDYQEFRRAYRTAFVYWLKTAAVNKKKAESEAAFANLLVELAKGKEAVDILKAFEAAYDGAPLSSSEMSEGALETRFLNWLPKGS